MNAETFVNNVVMPGINNSSIEDVIASLKDPPGREPHPSLIKRSQWFNALSVEDKNLVEEVVKDSVRSTILDLLCILDGTRCAVKYPEHFELYWAENYEPDSRRTLINDESFNPSLQDVYKRNVDEELYK